MADTVAGYQVKEKSAIGQEPEPTVIIVATGGSFDPIHIGHIRLFIEAKKLGDKLVVMLNSDKQLMKKKGRLFYPSQEERKEILESIECIDEVMIDPGEEVTCEKALMVVKPHILAKGGDRDSDHMPECEIAMCKRLGIHIVYNVGGGKVRSSSELTRDYLG